MKTSVLPPLPPPDPSFGSSDFVQFFDGFGEGSDRSCEVADRDDGGLRGAGDVGELSGYRVFVELSGEVGEAVRSG